MTAQVQSEPTPRSRRALLAGAIGGIGALAMSAIGRASPVAAADGEAVLVGGEYASSTPTGITTSGATALYGTSNSGIGVRGESTAVGGVEGFSDLGFGVQGTSAHRAGVRGTAHAEGQPGALGWSTSSFTGVLGFSGRDVYEPDIPAAKPKTGVFGYAAQDTSSRGMWGESPGGIGVYGRTTSGFAGYFQGKVFTSSFHEMIEIATPAAPGANRARLFVRDVGGKTQLCVRFATGSVKLLAQEA